MKKAKTLSTLFLFSGVLLLVPSKGVAITLAPLKVNCMGTEVGTIDVDTGDHTIPGTNISINGITDIKGTFTTTLASLDAAANQCWGGHFNWLNIVRSTMMGATLPNPKPAPPPAPVPPPVTPPFIDPLSGGNFFGKEGNDDDDKPFYWNQTALPLITMGKSFMFFDEPQNVEGAMVNFETYLVAVPGGIEQMGMQDMTFHVLTGFKWKFTQVTPKETPLLRNTITELMAINNPDVVDINKVLKAKQNFPGWTAIDIRNHCKPKPPQQKSNLNTQEVNVCSVPEPSSTLGLLALGTLGAASTLKRKQKQNSN